MTGGASDIFLIRHAPTVGKNGAIYGSTDIDADISDHVTFDELAQQLLKDSLWFSSDLRRAQMTAQALRCRMGGIDLPPLELVAELREQDFGAWEGLRWNEIPHEISQKFWQDPFANRPEGGESFSSLFVRVAAWLRSLETCKPIIAICHAGPIRAALSIANGINPASALALEVKHLQIYRIDPVSLHT